MSTKSQDSPALRSPLFPKSPMSRVSLLQQPLKVLPKLAEPKRTAPGHKGKITGPQEERSVQIAWECRGDCPSVFRCPLPLIPRNHIDLSTPIPASHPGERVWGCRSLSPAARAAPLLPAQPHLWPRRQLRRDSCISRRPPLGSRPRLAFSASQLPAAPPRHRAGPAAAAAAAGPRPSPAARPQRPRGSGRTCRAR